jgi:DNA-nicking Smr family endonuclease
MSKLKEEDRFNPLFKEGPPKIGKKQHPSGKEKKPAPAPARPSREIAFLDAMSGVTPLPEEPRARVRTRENRIKHAGPAPGEARRVRDHLLHLSTGAVEAPPEIQKRVGSREEDMRAPRERKVPKGNEFLEAMSGVTPLPDEPRTRVRTRESQLKPANPAPDETREVMDHLSHLVKGVIEMDITFSAEYIEGSVRGFDREVMKRLKRGEYPIQDHIDLHGLTREEAQVMVKGFILNSFKMGLRCVLIIHGRGLNSPESFPVLKEGLPIWLGRGPVKRIVLAFSTAKPYDGGTGAVYVLLRRR